MQVKEITAKLRALLGIRETVDWLFYGLLAVAIIALVDFARGAREADQQWDEFKDAHHCKPNRDSVGGLRGGWTCDDGKTYYLWRQQR